MMRYNMLLVTVQHISGVVIVDNNSYPNKQTIIIAKKMKWRRIMKRKHQHFPYVMHKLIVIAHDYKSSFS